MTSVKVRYIGAKVLKEDNVANTGTVWLGNGDVQPLALEAWAKLAKHTTVWELVDDDAEPPAKRTLATAAPQAAALPATVVAVESLHAIGSPLGTLAADSIINGSSTQESHVDIGGTSVPLGLIVASAQTASGLSTAEWNELGEDDRDDFIATEIETMRNADSDAKVKAAAEALAADKTKQAAEKPAMTHAELKEALTKLQVPHKGSSSRVALQALYDEATKA